MSQAGTVAWECPSNIALIKYWGKKDNQIPANPSLSFTLSECYTHLAADYSVRQNQSFSLEYLFEGSKNPLFANRLESYLEVLNAYFPFLKNARLKMDSRNSFPHSSGIASSASFFGATALVLCSIEQQLSGKEVMDESFYRKASLVARLGSGSACRSIFGGMALWGVTPGYKNSSDESAIPFREDISPVFIDYRDSILIISSAAKDLSSSKGHELMKDHTFKEARFSQAGINLRNLIRAIRAGDLNGFADITELESLTLHALMMTSGTGYMLFKPGTLEIINRIRDFRRTTGIPAAFSLDAGPNVHLLYPFSVTDEVHTFINAELRAFCEDGRVIHDHAGDGPVRKI
jgi:diphosphomevalonate decarboxylase